MVSANQNFRGSCLMSFQFSNFWCMRLISIEQLKEWDIFKIALLYTDQKCSYKQIPDLMQAFPLDTEIY